MDELEAPAGVGKLVGDNTRWREEEGRYVVGFAFDHTRDNVLLIRKLRPAWQAGRLNGVGGRMEYGEDSQSAMVREFEEETGLSTTVEQWRVVTTCSGMGPKEAGERSNKVAYYLSVLRAFDVDIAAAEHVEEEQPVVVSVSWVRKAKRHEVIANLPWLVPMALEPLLETCHMVMRAEGW